MKNRSPLFLLLAIAAIPVFAPAGAGRAEGTFDNLPKEKMERNSAKECAICHISWIDVFYFEGRGTELTERPPAESVASEEMCFSCHNGSLVDSREKIWDGRRGHPVNRVLPAGSTIPELLPLGRGSRIVCATCHTAHGVPDRTRFEQIIFLRVANRNSELCLLCHRDRAGGPHAGNHSLRKPVDAATRKRIEELGGRFGESGSLICESCHAAHGGAPERMLLLTDRSPDGKPGLCEACHGVNPGKDSRPDAALSHPVGRPSAPGRLPAAWDGGEKIRTGPGGALLCISCHRPHNAVRDTRLLVRAGGAGFCLQCHSGQSTVSETKHELDVAGAMGRKDVEEGLGKFGVCGPCHVVHGATGPRLFALPFPPQESADAVSRICLSCHREGDLAGRKAVGGPLHAGGRPAPEGMPVEGFPLYGTDGERAGTVVSCATCHDVHRWDPANPANRPGRKVEGDASTSFLRYPDTAESALCLRCHREKELIRKTGHDPAVVPEILRGRKASLCGSCHGIHGAKTAPLTAPKVPALEGVDRISAICFSCHGEGGIARRKPDGWEGHPVGKIAPEAMKGSGLPLFGPDNAVRGTFLACATCHDVHRWDPANPANRPGRKVKGDASTSFLRVPNAGGSPLCLKCHGEKETIAGTAHDPGVVPEIRQGKPADLCGGCHAAHGAKGLRGWPAKVPARDGKDPVSTLCLACHGAGGVAKSKTAGQHGHATGKEVPAGMDIGGLPLQGADGSARGKVLTCATCHDVHRWDPVIASNRPGKKVPGDSSTDFLRIPSSGDALLCSNCHVAMQRVVGTRHDFSAFPPPAGTAGDPAGRGVCSPCHRAHDAREARLLWARDVYKSGSPDPVGPLCRSCHRKDSLAGKKTVKEPLHPVGVPWKGSPIPLPLSPDAAGKETLVTCATCHDPHGLPPSPADTGSNGGERKKSLTRLPVAGEKGLCGVCHTRQTTVVDTPHDRRKMNVLFGPPGDRDLEAGTCVPCHSVHAPSESSSIWAGPIGKGEDRMTRFCTGCHLDPKLVPKKRFFLPQHPKDVYITNRGTRLRGSTADFPLFDKDGRRQPFGIITCPTCHDPHRWDAADPLLKPAEGEAGSVVNDFLRNKGASFGFCAECHSFTSILLYRNFHDPREWKRSGPGIPEDRKIR